MATIKTSVQQKRQVWTNFRNVLSDFRFTSLTRVHRTNYHGHLKLILHPRWVIYVYPVNIMIHFHYNQRQIEVIVTVFAKQEKNVLVITEVQIVYWHCFKLKKV